MPEAKKDFARQQGDSPREGDRGAAGLSGRFNQYRRIPQGDTINTFQHAWARS